MGGDISVRWNEALILLEKHLLIVQSGHKYGKNLKVVKSIDKSLPVYNTAIEKLKRDIKSRTKWCSNLIIHE